MSHSKEVGKGDVASIDSPLEEIDRFERLVMGGCPVFTARQRRAAVFLESKGMHFLKQYGFQNCEAIAVDQGWDEMRGEQ